jgi:hypothetical protein
LNPSHRQLSEKIGTKMRKEQKNHSTGRANNHHQHVTRKCLFVTGVGWFERATKTKPSLALSSLGKNRTGFRETIRR